MQLFIQNGMQAYMTQQTMSKTNKRDARVHYIAGTRTEYYLCLWSKAGRNSQTG